MAVTTARHNDKLALLGGITQLRVRGYKSLADDYRFAIRPLTVLAGANSSGKSSAMQPLLLLKQTLEATYDPGALLLDGPSVRFTLADQLFSRASGTPSVSSFIVGFGVAGGAISMEFEPAKQGGVEIAEMALALRDSPVLGLVPGMASHDVLAALRNSTLWDGMRPTEADVLQYPLEWRVARARCFLTIEMYRSDTAAFLGGVPLTGPLEGAVRSVVHLPGLRGNPRRTYPMAAVGPTFPGTFESYTASLIRQWQVDRAPALKGLRRHLEQLGLTWKVQAKQVDDTQVELQVGRLPHSARGGARDLVNIADVGFGVSQTLPVLVALLTAGPGQLVYLEQPEIHLHPRAQVALGAVLAEAANRGVRVVVETHSSLLLLSLQTLIAKGVVAKDDACLHWFDRGPDGVTKITTAEPDAAGAFGDWPEDFGKVMLDAQRDYLDAARERRRQLPI